MVSPVAVRLRHNRPGASPVPRRVETSRRVLVTDLVTGLHPQELARDIDIISWLPAPRSTMGRHLPVRTFVDHSFRCATSVEPAE